MRIWISFKKTRLLFFIIFAIIQPAYSQGTGSIAGSVISAKTGKSLIGVRLSLVGTFFETITDSIGSFKLNSIPDGTYNLSINYLGYESFNRIVNIKVSETIQLQIQLNPITTVLKDIIVNGRAAGLKGIALSASEGQVSQAQFRTKPILRTGEILETIPGLIITQHSGSGKANQYFLRGFNLDHGTDFATSVDGVPINLTTHAHGQGYLDINFLIPELIKMVKFRKGPYYADAGDFSTTGNAQILLVDSLDETIAKVGVGLEGYYRGLFANSWKTGKGNLLLGINYQHYDGPWLLPDNSNLFSGIIKYSSGNMYSGYAIEAMGYHNNWHATDQIPQRAVENGSISRFAAIDATDGGNTERYTLVGNWWQSNSNGTLIKATAYVAYYDLDLFSNFTYFLNFPNRGDQIEQVGHRLYSGGKFSYKWFVDGFGQKSSFTVGVELRHDQIFQVALFNTDARKRFNTVRNDRVGEISIAGYTENNTHWTDKFKTIVGLRANLYRFEVHSKNPDNSGIKTAPIVSPKISLIFGPWAETEFYANFGLGFHSNDARGVTINVEPVSGDAVQPVDPLVGTRGAELGIRTNIVSNLHSTLALWYVGLQSELVFSGDEGSTEASGSSTHYGIEWSNYYNPTNWLTLNLDLSITQSYFNDKPQENKAIPNSIGRIITSGIIVGNANGIYGSLRLRYFGPRPLTESSYPKSQATTILNFKGGYRFKHVELSAEVLNILNTKAPDISYFYESQLKDERSPVEDIHFHPTIPITARFTISYHF